MGVRNKEVSRGEGQERVAVGRVGGTGGSEKREAGKLRRNVLGRCLPNSLASCSARTVTCPHMSDKREREEEVLRVGKATGVG